MKVVIWIKLGFVSMIVFFLSIHDNIINCVNERSTLLVVEVAPPAFLGPVPVAVFHQIPDSFVLKGRVASPGD